MFELPEVPCLRPRFNIAPDQPVAVVRFDPPEGSRTLDLLTWGLIPSWADDPAIGDRRINARTETVTDKPAFRHPFLTQRCLVVAGGYYEWHGWKRPFFVHRRGDRPSAFAGLWEDWEKGEEPIYSCLFLTTDASEAMAPIHDRMPVILPRSAYDLWLDPGVHDPRLLEPLLVPFPIRELEAYEVHRHVNEPANDDPECIRPLETRDWMPGLEP